MRRPRDAPRGPTETAPEADDALPPGGSSRRRIAVTVFVTVTLAAVFTQHMPDSTIKTGLMTAAQPYLNLTGLDQTWSIFSPNPRGQTVYVVARVEQADGAVVVHPIPTGTGPSEYWGYRWQKYGESVAEPGGRVLWRPYAEWVAGQDQLEGGRPVRVTLTRRVSVNLPPGSSPAARPFVDEDIYTATVRGR
jgi:hypothetical protein